MSMCVFECLWVCVYECECLLVCVFVCVSRCVCLEVLILNTWVHSSSFNRLISGCSWMRSWDYASATDVNVNTPPPSPTHTEPHTQTHSETQLHRQTRTHSHTHTDSLQHTHTQHTESHTDTHRHIHTNRHNHTHTHTHPHTHTKPGRCPWHMSILNYRCPEGWAKKKTKSLWGEDGCKIFRSTMPSYSYFLSRPVTFLKKGGQVHLLGAGA